ncbi:MAG TPA: ATP-dependent DNA helicase [Candidatus Nanoarchaeia archaeon]|nr:ATP-dependent DNA helicase [Candidatus Nanoarchaeia archaeon]
MQLFFPHEKIRESQKELMDKIQETLENKTNLIAHAPTGLGKSAASLSVALSYAIEKKLTVFFVTPKHTQHRIAIETLKEIKEKHNLDFSVVDLIGKKWMCAQEGVTEMSTGEFYDYCKDMIKNGKCSYYNNIKNKDKLSIETQVTISELSKKILHVEEMRDIAKDRMLCPFEVACLVAKKATVIIADYHHIISSSIRDSLLERIGKNLSECIVIIDEAHNLPTRCRELLSTQISNQTIDFSVKEAEALGYPEIADSIKYIEKCFETIKNKKLNYETKEALITKDELINEIKKNIDIDQINNDIIFIGEKTLETKKRSASTFLANFLINWNGPDESFTRVIQMTKNNKGKDQITISYSCLDPSLITRPLAQSVHSLICMSGTLTPIDMYKDILGFETIAAEFKNPFPENNKLTIIIPDTTTKYTARSPEMFKQIANYCASIVNEVPGHSAIFFPSYDLRDKVNFHFQNQCIKTTFTELPNMTKEEKNELLEKFKQYGKSGAVLLGASSGNFGEGVDIKDNILKCVIIVGIPLDRPDLETQQLIEYYNKKFNKGWDYGYIMPAIIKCLQNAGRCIRSETDKGLVIYLDQRYIWDSYFKCFPKDNSLRITKTPIDRIRTFFNEV